MSTLYLVATPIGNLEDMTHRAVRILNEVSLVAAEDTRSARVLFQRYGITTKTTSYNEHNAQARTPSLLRALDKDDVALISDAGTPAISDPGSELAIAALEAGHEVVAVPGASAVVTAVVASGLDTRRFHYLGFLPRQPGPRRKTLAAAAQSGNTLVVYEAPHRLRATLNDALDALGDRRIAVCRELTKLHEEVWRGSISAAIEHFAEPRGEFTLVIEGGTPRVAAESPTAVADELRSTGAPAKAAVAELMRRCGLSRRDAYALWHRD